MPDSLQVVYVLSSSGWDKYAKMVWISASAVRRLHPGARITTLLDEATWEAFGDGPNRLPEVVDRLVRVETGLTNKVESSFTMKTRVRGLVEGDYVYLDGDTLPIAPFADMLAVAEPMAACLDCNLDLGNAGLVPPKHAKLLREIGWPADLPHYVNCGIMAVKDTPRTRAVCTDWRRRYEIMLRHGCWDDQPAFNVAVHEDGVPMHLLPKAYNAMVLINPSLCRGGRILHFFASHQNVYGTLMTHLLEHLDRTGQFDEAAVRHCVRVGHPWAPNCEAWQLWRSRNYVRAVAAKFRKLILPPRGNREAASRA